MSLRRQQRCKDAGFPEPIPPSKTQPIPFLDIAEFYSGDKNYLTATSTAITVTVTAK
jgi:hypothetical protein